MLPNCSGLEARWMGEVGHTVAKQGLKLEDANRIVLRLIEEYEHIFGLPGGNPGSSFELAYDLETLKPVKRWQELVESVKIEACAMGLAL